jgi:hypothetical protein
MPFDLIYSRKANNTALDIKTLIEKCPAILTETASPETSGRYGFVSTMQAINVLDDWGYKPTQSRQTPSRKSEKKPYAQHMLSFAHESDLNADNAETRPEIILYNSHDGRSALKLFAGAYRYICSNGLIGGDGFQHKLNHVGKGPNDFENLLAGTIESMGEMMDTIEFLQNHDDTTPVHILDFAYNAAKLRWEKAPETIDENTATGSFFNDQTLKGLARYQRPDDMDPNNAWKAFNVIQENLLRGGPRVLSLSPKAKAENQGFKYRDCKAVKSLPEIVRINQGLWDNAKKLCA